MRMAKLDPTKMKDWEIAEAAEKDMKTVYQQAEELGLEAWSISLSHTHEHAIAFVVAF
jgi:phosphopantetheinyl transferase (holo-ACP synthase)